MRESLRLLRDELSRINSPDELSSWKERFEELLREAVEKKLGVKCRSPVYLFKTLYHAGFINREELDALLQFDELNDPSFFERLLERLETRL
ncbi:MAG: hypothetical protein GXO03_04015 [Aquificae bacterium]|nr:hypothetical protein [Aquificota bacterium]